MYSMILDWRQVYYYETMTLQWNRNNTCFQPFIDRHDSSMTELQVIQQGGYYFKLEYCFHKNICKKLARTGFLLVRELVILIF